MIKTYKKSIEDTLVNYFENEIKNPENDHFKSVIESMKYTTCLGGKRLRGVLCLEACNIFSASYKEALPTACAIEMLHAQSLIHDDLPSMDNDDLRRGKPANHKIYGEAIAILAGDALISYGSEIIIDKTPENIDCKTILKVLKQYNRAAGAYGIVGGQTADIEAEKAKEKIGIEHLKCIHKYKTGALFKMALVTGALIGGANEKEIEKISKFGDCYGLAFQISDDILDEISNSTEMGKTIGKDKEAGKATYVTLYGLKIAKEKFSEAIQDCYAILNDIFEDSKNKPDVFREIIESMIKMIDR